MKKLAFIGLVFLCGCSTPSTVLKNPQTGQIARCGGNVSGSLAGGAIGYHIQKDNDQNVFKATKIRALRSLRKRISYD